MKELATRQRLRELKEAMAAGKPFTPYSTQNGDLNGQVEPSSNQNVVENVENKVNGDMSVNDINDNAQNTSTVSNTKVPNTDFYAKKKSEKDPTSRWESNYARPTTPSNLSFQNEVQQNTSNITQGDQNDTRVSFNVAEDTPEKDVKDKRKQILTEEDMLEIQSKRFERELNSRHCRNKEKENDRRTYIPSEYVNGISKTDQFDARKMNLTSKTFDSALSSMLGPENSKMIPDNTEYEQYARTNKYQPNPYLEPQRPTRSRTRSQRGQRSGKHREAERQRETGSAEGRKPEREAGVSLYFTASIKYLETDIPVLKISKQMI